MEEDHQNITIVDSSVCFNAYALLKSGNMWCDTHIVKIHPNGMAMFKKIVVCQKMNKITMKSEHLSVGGLFYTKSGTTLRTDGSQFKRIPYQHNFWRGQNHASNN